MKWFLYFILLFQVSFCYAQDVDEAVGAEPVQYSPDSSAVDTSQERILNYHSNIVIDKDGLVTVSEKIKVIANGDHIKRGIFRMLPLRLNINGKKTKAQYKIVSVTKDGQPEPYKKEKDSDFLKIYVGSKDVLLNSGVYNYEIVYTTSNQIGFFDNYDEFYWNVSGTDWSFPIDTISAQVTLPNNAYIVQNSCYTGVFGSKETNCSYHKIDNHTISWEAKRLGSEEGLTIAVGFNKGVFLPPPPPSFLEKYGVFVFLGLIFCGLLFYTYQLWRKYGVDPIKPVVYPQFNVPEDLSPATLGYLNFESYKSEFITAAIVNLAVKGYLKIEESEESGFLGLSNNKVFKLVKLRDDYQSLPDEESSLFLNLFPHSKSIKIDGSYNSKIENSVNDFERFVIRKYKPLLKEGNNTKKLLKPALAISGAYLLGLIISFFVDREVGRLILGFLVLGIAAVFSAISIAIINRTGASKVKLGCASIFFIFFGIAFVTSFVLPLLFATFSSSIEPSFRACFIFLFASTILFILFAYLIKSPSVEKLKIQSLIDGFKMYMGAAENEQLKFHNPPQFTPQLFEKYLPYAIVLGVDKIWGDKFENLVQQSSLQYTNNWYTGVILGSSFGSTLNSSLTESVSSSSTPPSSSSSGGGSGSSGSSGGGSSGGGGGGGGGGGW